MRDEERMWQLYNTLRNFHKDNVTAFFDTLSLSDRQKFTDWMFSTSHNIAQQLIEMLHFMQIIRTMLPNQAIPPAHIPQPEDTELTPPDTSNPHPGLD